MNKAIDNRMWHKKPKGETPKSYKEYLIENRHKLKEEGYNIDDNGNIRNGTML